MLLLCFERDLRGEFIGKPIFKAIRYKDNEINKDFIA